MEIWKEIKKNAESGAQRLVAEYGNRLYSAATLLCKDANEADDLAFRTFEQAVKKIHSYRPTGDFFGWLYAIMLNFYRMDLRKHKPDIILAGAPADLPESTAAQPPPRRAETEIRDAVRRLPAQMRTVVVLNYFLGLSIDEISSALSIAPGTVKSRLFTARKILADSLNITRRKG